MARWQEVSMVDVVRWWRAPRDQPTPRHGGCDELQDADPCGPGRIGTMPGCRRTGIREVIRHMDDAVATDWSNPSHGPSDQDNPWGPFDAARRRVIEPFQALPSPSNPTIPRFYNRVTGLLCGFANRDDRTRSPTGSGVGGRASATRIATPSHLPMMAVSGIRTEGMGVRRSEASAARSARHSVANNPATDRGPPTEEDGRGGRPELG